MKSNEVNLSLELLKFYQFEKIFIFSEDFLEEIFLPELNSTATVAPVSQNSKNQLDLLKFEIGAVRKCANHADLESCRKDILKCT